MFVGHLAVALAAKRVEPRLPLAASVAAAFGLDLLWPVFLLTGLEIVRIDPGNTAFTPLDFESYPWSHSLVMSLVWGACAALVASALLRHVRAGLFIGLLVVSHWVLDWITHRPDLPIWPHGPLAGLGLWNSIAATIAIEGTLLVAGVGAYLTATRAVDAKGTWTFWSFTMLCAVLWLAGPFSPPPPSATAIAIVGLASAIVFPIWARWIDRHRATY